VTTAPQTSQHRQAIFWLVIANLFWGFSFPIIKSIGAIETALVPGAGTWFVAASVIVPRFALAALVIGAFWFGAIRTLDRREILQGLELGFFTGCGMIFQIDGLQYTSASTSAFLTQFYAIMIPVWLAVRARRWPAPIVWVCCVLVLAGAGVLAHLDWRDLHLGRGEIETLVSSVFFMGQILCLDRAEFAGTRPMPVTFVMLVVQALIGVTLGLFTAPAHASPLALTSSGLWWGLTLALTIFCTLGAFTLMNTWQPRITATEAGLIYSGEPVFAATMALFLPGLFSAWGGIDYPNERATANLLIGGGLITAANVLLQLRPPPKPQPAA
jgi:drug/metabolite transporter (DMT)-like permease